jgi:uncharacterized protein YecT (DUF1311 family)
VDNLVAGLNKSVRCIEVLYLVLGLSLSSIAYSKAECTEDGTKISAVACAENAKIQADTQLNDSYKELNDRAESRYILQYQSQPDIQKKFIAQLKDSQRAWMKLRDTNCPLELFESEWDKVSYAIGVDNCIAKMSLERAAYLNKIIPSQ